jgi:antitoxin component YwqK of YwqJK toxin-antitoxin module
MAPRELSAISLLLISLISCDPAKQEKLTWYRLEEIRLENNNGLVFYRDRPFSGIVFSFYPATKDTAEVIGFRKGREHGEWRKFFPGGKLSVQRFFDHGTKVKTLKEWWENGRLKVSGSFLKGENNGEYKEWNRNGMLIRDMHYRLGYEEGSQKQFYDNGKIRSNYIVKTGRRFGLLGTKNCVNVTDRIFQK